MSSSGAEQQNVTPTKLYYIHFLLYFARAARVSVCRDLHWIFGIAR